MRWFPNLKKLRVQTDYDRHSLPSPPEPLSPDLALESIEILSDMSCLGILLREIAKTKSVHSVEHLACRLWFSSSAIFAPFVARAGPNIRSLELSFQDERLLDDLMRGQFIAF